ncbi:MAG TPA: hypothetical protein V6C98_08945 [Thermosynechococcaceae cyanobacterium]
MWLQRWQVKQPLLDSPSNGLPSAQGRSRPRSRDPLHSGIHWVLTQRLTVAGLSKASIRLLQKIYRAASKVYLDHKMYA